MSTYMSKNNNDKIFFIYFTNKEDVPNHSSRNPKNYWFMYKPKEIDVDPYKGSIVSMKLSCTCKIENNKINN